MSLVITAARLSGPERRTISSAEVAVVDGSGTETAASTLRFVSSVGLFVGSRGRYAVTEAGWAITRLFEDDEMHARLQLQALVLTHWSVPAARELLADGPMPLDELGRRLHGDLPGKPRRGVYLVEWLALALLVHRDRQNLVWPAPALGTGVGSSLSAAAPAAPAAVHQEEPDEEPNYLMGWTNSGLRQLSPERYCAVLDSMTEVAELTLG
ncbi:hypothetical protein [Streptomyces sp. SP2-10]|uniref:hypothetical protein n=1 Tax=Streptomyces sp. SP2-10 TaxID=2873385 RepID=UPI001CA6D523|nr:hypothetical protein [Streptomyces sp. SP2-10]MBY8844579.1 hypothetical protein [Streptomyces sp. SP2-10]